MKKTWSIVSCLVLSLMFVLVGCSGVGSQAVETRRVSYKGLSIEFPKDWDVKKADDGKYIYPDYGGLLYVSCNDELDMTEESVEEFYESFVDGLESDPALFIVSEPTESEIGEAVALRSEARYEADDDTLKGWNELIISGSNGYNVMFLVPEDVYDDNEDAILEILDGIKLKKSEAPGATKPSVDKTSLSATIADAKALTNDGYTDDSWENLQQAISDGEAVVADESATQSQVNSAETAITNAVGALVTPADKSALNSKLAEAKGLSSDGYTDKSWQTLQNAITAGDAVAADEGATQTEVDQAEAAITNAINGLVSYQWPSYTDVARTPDDWEGVEVAFTGQVIQVLETSYEVDLRVATDGYYGDVIYVTYDPDIMDGIRVLEGDNITIYGTCTGLYTYTAVLGQSISLPGITADKIVVN